MLRTLGLKLFSTYSKKRNLRKVARKREKRLIGTTVFIPKPRNHVTL